MLLQRFWIVPALAIAAAVGATGTALGRGYDFRNFDKNPPLVGDKAPLPEGFDEKGGKLALSSLLDGNHLALVFGALT